jgi:hypothetical protein
MSNSCPMFNHFPDKTKAVVTIAELARMVGLSRARFYQLLGTAFPPPVYDIKTRRPYYTEEQQKVCLEVRRRNCGVDGKPILFYARRGGSLPLATTRKLRKATHKKEHIAIIQAVKSLGLTGVTNDQVSAVIKLLFPGGVELVDQAEAIRGVFVHLQRQNRADKVGG